MFQSLELDVPAWFGMRLTLLQEFRPVCDRASKEARMDEVECFELWVVPVILDVVDVKAYVGRDHC